MSDLGTIRKSKTIEIMSKYKLYDYEVVNKEILKSKPKPIKELPSLDGIKYPSAKEWMWDYCTYLGTYEIDGEFYDLGVFFDEPYDFENGGEWRPLNATVQSNKEGDYNSTTLVGRNFNFPMYEKVRDLVSEYFGIEYIKTEVDN